jgi:hypothetical protein
VSQSAVDKSDHPMYFANMAGRGDHHVFTKTDVVEIINIQPQGAKAKPYQVKQVRNLIIKYGLGR